jgi:hypothetical protein
MVTDRPLVDPKIPLVPPPVVPTSQRFHGPPMAALIDLVAQQLERAFSQNYNVLDLIVVFDETETRKF